LAGARELVTPLVITAELGGPVCLPNGRLHLDALLAAAVARRDGIQQALDLSMVQPIEIPVEREPQGRFHLCSSSLLEVEASELRYTNRRAPVEQYQTLGSKKIKTIQISLGANKSYRTPRYVSHSRDDLVSWFAVGDGTAIRELLDCIGHLGKRRAVGLGKVLRWTVEECDPWDGFPVVRDGKPLRPLPTDWHGVTESKLGLCTITFPYWDHAKEDMCLLPPC
jgi:CRISPR type IV-associated protein Csf3